MRVELSEHWKLSTKTGPMLETCRNKVGKEMANGLTMLNRVGPMLETVGIRLGKK